MAVLEEQEAVQAVREILARKDQGYRNLISVLRELQERAGWLPKEAMKEIARHFNISPANVYSVATFYNQFRFTPPGRCHIKMCMGTACHIKQGDLVLDQWKRRLGIEEGQRTEDGEYSLERVACVGACAMAPVSVVGDEVVGFMTPNKVDGILLQHRLAKEKAERENKETRGDSAAEGPDRGAPLSGEEDS